MPNTPAAVVRLHNPTAMIVKTFNTRTLYNNLDRFYGKLLRQTEAAAPPVFAKTDSSAVEKELHGLLLAVSNIGKFIPCSTVLGGVFLDGIFHTTDCMTISGRFPLLAEWRLSPHQASHPSMRSLACGKPKIRKLLIGFT